MLHFVHQLVDNRVYLLFGAEQVVYSGFLGAISWKDLPVQNTWFFFKRKRPNLGPEDSQTQSE